MFLSANNFFEADKRAPSSPRGTQVLATTPNLFGNGHEAEMSYYELPNWLPDVQRLIENLWTHLAHDEVTSGPIGNVDSPG